VLLVALLLPAWVCARARPLDGVVALELFGATTTLTLLCLAEGYHRGAYFGVALVSSILSWVGGLVIARLLARAR
jgi:multisubunit Na+/H+ antiporter MnhF subunit